MKIGHDRIIYNRPEIEAWMRPWLWLSLLTLAQACGAQTVEESFARDPGTLDFIRGEGFEQAIAQALTGDALVGLDAQNHVVPRLSDAWHVKGRAISFHLRENVRFPSGAPLKAADVVWTFQQIKRSPEASPTKRMILEGVNISTKGEDVELSSSKPAQRLLMELARISIARQGHGEEGSGPFLLTRRGTEWTFTARAHFLHPKIKAIHFRLVSDDQALLLNLQKGWLSIGVPPARHALKPPAEFRELHQATHAQLIVWSKAGLAPLQSLEHWRAEAFPPDFFGGKAKPSRGLWPETLGFQAMRISAARPPTLKGQHWELLYSAGDELVQKVLLSLRECARKEGVDLEPKPIEAALLFERLQKGDFQLASALNVFDPHPWSVLELMQPNGPLNFSGWTDANYATLEAQLQSPESPAWPALQRAWAAHPTSLPILDFTSIVWVDHRLKMEPSALGLYLTTPGPSGWSWTP